MIAGSLKYFLDNGSDLLFSGVAKGATTVIKGVKSAGKAVLNTIKGSKNIPKNPSLTKATSGNINLTKNDFLEVSHKLSLQKQDRHIEGHILHVKR